MKSPPSPSPKTLVAINQSVKQTTTYLIFLATIVMTLTYVSDLFEMYFNDKFHEGYLFVIKIFMFDIAIIIPLIITLVLKNSVELKIWGVLSVILQNVILFLGIKVGPFFGVIIGIILTTYFIVKYKRIMSNDNTTNSSQAPAKDLASK